MNTMLSSPTPISPTILLRITLLTVTILTWISRGVDASSNSTKTYYMQGQTCGTTRTIFGATVSAFDISRQQAYDHNIDCRITFKSPKSGWKLQINMVQVDIPDVSYGSLCNDALYIYNSKHVFKHAMVATMGLCGTTTPAIIHSTGRYVTVYFRTDQNGIQGSGFKFVATAFVEAYINSVGCPRQLFACQSSHRCISRSLLCDGVDHCGDMSDELDVGASACSARGETSLVSQLLNLGTTATIGLTIGGALVTLTMLACLFVCICRCFDKSKKAPMIHTKQSPIDSTLHQQHHHHNHQQAHVKTELVAGVNGTPVVGVSARSQGGVSNAGDSCNHATSVTINNGIPIGSQSPYPGSAVSHHMSLQGHKAGPTTNGYFAMHQVSRPPGSLHNTPSHLSGESRVTSDRYYSCGVEQAGAEEQLQGYRGYDYGGHQLYNQVHVERG